MNNNERVYLRRDEDVATPVLVTSIPIVDGVLDHYAAALGDDFIPYRNHVHRVVNLCLAVTGGRRDDLEKIAIAAAFHDLGIWTDHTFDSSKGFGAPTGSTCRADSDDSGSR